MLATVKAAVSIHDRFRESTLLFVILPVKNTSHHAARVGEKTHLYEFQLKRGKTDHLQEQPPVLPSLNIGLTVDTLFIPDRHI
jgi:hypothetical protein